MCGKVEVVSIQERTEVEESLQVLEKEVEHRLQIRSISFVMLRCVFSVWDKSSCHAIWIHTLDIQVILLTCP